MKLSAINSIVRVKHIILVGSLLALASAITISMAMQSSAYLTPDPMLKTINTFDNTADEDDVTVAESYDSGDPFNEVTTPANGSVFKYDDAKSVFNGGKSARISTSSTAQAVYGGWTSTVLGSNTELYASIYVWLDAAPTTNIRIMEFRGSGLRDGNIDILANTGKIRITDAAGSSSTSTSGIALGQWVRIDGMLAAHPTTGSIEAKYFNTADSTTPTETVTRTGVDTKSVVSGVRFGVAVAAANLSAFWIDEARVRLDAYPGPYQQPESVVVTNEDFEDGTYGKFNKLVNVSLDTSAPLDGNRSLYFDATNGTSWAEKTQASDGADKRYAYIAFKYKHSGSNISSNQPVLNVRNTNSVTSNGGGHLNMWADATSGTFKGDLMSINNFNTNVTFNTGQEYYIEALVGFNSDSTSFARIRIDGNVVATISSTTSGGDRFRSVLLGSTTQNSSYQVRYDNVTVVTSANPIDLF